VEPKKWWQQTERINGKYFREVVKVHRLAAKTWLNEDF